ncbi:unnamed protein product [Prunus armeniaca]
MELSLQQIYVHKRKLVKPDRRLSASEYSLLSIKRDASLASTRCRRKVRFSGKPEDQICSSARFSWLRRSVRFVIACSFICRAFEEEDGFSRMR